jgi:hypothetical protein
LNNSTSQIFVLDNTKKSKIENIIAELAYPEENDRTFTPNFNSIYNFGAIALSPTHHKKK